MTNEQRIEQLGQKCLKLQDQIDKQMEVIRELVCYSHCYTQDAHLTAKLDDILDSAKRIN